MSVVNTAPVTPPPSATQIVLTASQPTPYSSDQQPSRLGRTGRWEGQELHDLLCSILIRKPHTRSTDKENEREAAWGLVSLDLGGTRTANACETRYAALKAWKMVRCLVSATVPGL